MAKCCFCDEQAQGNCAICQTPTCEHHKHPVNRWHNVFHARWICEKCYQAKERRRKIVVVPIIFMFVYLIAKTMDIKWGIKEPSLWIYFWALASVALGVLGFAAIYHTVVRSGKARMWLIWLLPALIFWAVIYLILKILGGL